MIGTGHPVAVTCSACDHVLVLRHLPPVADPEDLMNPIGRALMLHYRLSCSGR